MAQKKFAFSADCKTLEQCIKRVTSVVGQSASMYLGIHGKHVRVTGSSPEAFASCQIPNATTADAEGILCFSDKLVGLIKGRALMDFEFEDTTLHFKQQKGRYKGELPTVSVSEDQAIQLNTKITEKFDSSKVRADVLSVVRQGVQATSVKDVYLGSTLLSYITLAAGKLVVSSFDGQHFGLLRANLDTDAEFRAALPQTHFGILETLAEGEDLLLGLSKRGLKARGKSFDLMLPASQTDERHYEMVQMFVKALPEALCKCEIEVAALSEVVSNLFTLYNPNSNFSLTFAKGELTISLSGTSGSASDTLPIKFTGKSEKVSVDPRLLVDIVNLAKPCTTIRISVMPAVLLLSGKYGNADLMLSCARTE